MGTYMECYPPYGDVFRPWLVGLPSIVDEGISPHYDHHHAQTVEITTQLVQVTPQNLTNPHLS